MICLPNILSLKDKICINFFAMTLFGLGCMQKNCCVETHGSHHRYVKTMQIIFFSSVGSWVDRQEDSRYLQAFSMNSQPLATDTNMGYSVDRQEDSRYLQAFSRNSQPLATDTNMGYSVDRRRVADTCKLLAWILSHWQQIKHGLQCYGSGSVRKILPNQIRSLCKLKSFKSLKENFKVL